MKLITKISRIVYILNLFTLLITPLTPLYAAPQVETKCETPITVFDNKKTSIDINVPLAGGTTCKDLDECPKIVVPADKMIYSIKASIKQTAPAPTTPYTPTVSIGTSSFPAVSLKTIDTAPQSFTICSDNSTSCNDPKPCSKLNFATANFPVNFKGEREIPLHITLSAGKYTIENLEVVFGSQTVSSSGGILPCNRNQDNPSTPWNDTVECGVCHFLLLIQLIIQYLLKLMVYITVLAMTIGGTMYMVAAGNTSIVNTAKQMINYAVVGFVVMLTAWIFINTVFFVLKFNNPLGGQWFIAC